MTKRSRSKRKINHKPEKLPESDARPKSPPRVPLWQALILPIAAILVFFLLLEGGLALFGRKPALQNKDPFVGFAANVPLFVPSKGPRGGEIMTTAPNRKNYFNLQKFSRIKPSDTYRIFCLGGSTTYGRPYDDSTSFAGWLREILPAVDKNKKWEVINAGGISYASYRVAHLMEELINYQPDLFIIYTGHNEFLEERTYSQIKEIPPFVKNMVTMLARTRTWSAMTASLEKLGIHPSESREKPTRLAVEVDAILDKSVGLENYTRDDPLKNNILKHYRISLQHMVEMARSVNSQVIFVTPASNLKDCSPFKSEYTDGLGPMDRQQAEEMLTKASEEIQHKNLYVTLKLLESATDLNPRHAYLQYFRGKLLLALKRFEAAKIALRRARDEDICPLRALTPMHQIVMQVAREQKVGVVDFVDLLERRMLKTQGHDIPGKEFFLDHVHPTIEGHKILAVALIKEMIEKEILQPATNWDKAPVAAVEEKIRGSIDEGKHGFALANLARVFLWAQKINDAERLANQALEMVGDNKHVIINSTTTLATVSLYKGEPERALEQLYSAIEQVPGAVELRLKLGQIFMDPSSQDLEKAAANLLLVSRQIPGLDRVHDLFGTVMAMRDRPRIAYPSLLQALRLNPNNTHSRNTLEKIQLSLQEKKFYKQPAKIVLETYPSAAPRRLVQIRRTDTGNQFRDGIDVEFYENGRLKRFLDVTHGKPNGLKMTWDADGKLLSRKIYHQGVPVENDIDT